MTAKIIDGIVIARSVRVGIGERAGALKARGVHPALTVILVEGDPASAIYVRNKIRACRFPMLMLITMRGEWEEFNPWQVPMGSITEECLRLAGFSTYRIDQPDRVDEIVRIAVDRAFNDNKAIAVILSQILIGKKDWR